ncbi:TetR/AcrR family transcriptional regulator [Bacillus pumilus]|uniref:forespore capture DNA-binding protein RefZ n=1 Tax=Bacillus pumilus TaxID=1408 RepID=UPI000D026F3D|nr:forespore capture DNA-binding protein RefZ [Bacillus pumilus]PRS29346.1 TetR/AcrR family transcriptional regulator [Bacillus pumilus]
MKASTTMQTKDRIIEAAIRLFNQKGFSGTSVREIAKEANVNVAHISYYFQGKGGLLEQLVSDFYEGYIHMIESHIHHMETRHAKECLLHVVFDILSYQHKHRQLTRFVYREVTIDSTLIREIMSTYLTKEKYLFQLIIEKGKSTHVICEQLSISSFMIQLKSLLMMPYLQPQYLMEVLYLNPNEPYFYQMYFKELSRSLHHLLEPKKPALDSHLKLMMSSN